MLSITPLSGRTNEPRKIFVEEKTYLVLQKIIPCLPTQHVANAELEDVEREVSDNAVEPDNARPAPSAPLDLRKRPVRVNSYQRRYLSQKIG